MVEQQTARFVPQPQRVFVHRRHGDLAALYRKQLRFGRRTKPRHRAIQTIRHARTANPLAQLHQRGMIGGRPSGIRQRLGPSPTPLDSRAIVDRLGAIHQSGEHPRHVAIHEHRRHAERKRPQSSRGVPPDTRQRHQLLQPLRKPAAMPVHHRPRGLPQHPRPPVISEALPRLQQWRILRRRQCPHI